MIWKQPGRMILFFTMMICFSCKSPQGQTQVSNTAEEKDTTVKEPVRVIAEKKLDFSAGPPTIVYRTKDDYRRNVAITLSDDKTKVTGFPHPNDVFYKSLLAYPYPLRGEYLLDNRGINKNTAFISMNYEQYSKLPEPPKPEELFEMIIDKEPFVEMCNCGNRNQFRNEITELNALIADSTLTKKCIKIK
ncbi:MAG: hypothetical protein EOP53_05355 [Sphingobacteriales bacterium]|nr:MAG: hypothetical protein EOP53_05355 [Sphingobacteriales bacterium]